MYIGSGKSAILAAIQICLGAGARRTNRARNLKELVCMDASCSHAKVRVTLLNGGDDAYHHEIYGNTITVERTISLKGGYNGYKLLDVNLKEQSRSKRDLDDMLDRLNIQVENPVAIMDQEDSKKFLKGKPEDKYAFFMKATELERIDRKYANTLDTLNEMGDQSDRMNRGLESDLHEMKPLKKEWEKHQRIEKLKDRLATLYEAYGWAAYKDSYKQLEQEIEVCTTLALFRSSYALLTLG
jgi:structural maintenance of chromosomes protein 6